MEIGDKLGTRNIRMFSFYPVDGEPFEEYEKKVFFHINALAEKAVENGFVLCHENEKGIYGDTVNRCLDILQTFNGAVGCVFDPANFIQCGEDPKAAFDCLYPYITYMHIKDALRDGTVTAAGEGDGNIEYMLQRLWFDKRETVLTLEPHLKTFSGLEKLENVERPKIKTVFKTNEEAFVYALNKLKEIINNIKTEDTENG
jgi:sugar phosphate isomerase/epimerase